MQHRRKALARKHENMAAMVAESGSHAQREKHCLAVNRQRCSRLPAYLTAG
jgi:hypothetical protein